MVDFGPFNIPLPFELLTNSRGSSSGASRPPEGHNLGSSGSGAARPPKQSFTAAANAAMERDLVVALDVIRCEMVSDGTTPPAPMSSSSLKVAGPYYRSFPEALAAAREKRARIEAVPKLEELEEAVLELGKAAAGFEQRLAEVDPYLASCVDVAARLATEAGALRERRVSGV